MNGKVTEQELEKRICEQLDAGIENLEQGRVAALRRARQSALAQGDTATRWQLPYWLTPARISLAAVTLLAVGLFTAVPQRTPSISADDLEVLSAPEQVELVQDLDFYRWLASTDATRHGDSQPR
jgi:hypothetical protein